MDEKEMAIKLLTLASSGEVDEAYEKYVHPDFIHHNIYFKGDRETLREGMKENAEQFPQKHYEVLRALKDGDLVAVHGWVQLEPGQPRMALIHIFRFDDGKIIEAWEAGQEEIDDSPNENGLF